MAQPDDTPDEKPEYTESTCVFLGALVRVLCTECVREGRGDTVIEVEIEHPAPGALEDFAAATFAIPCPRCTEAYGEDSRVVVQVLTGQQLDLADGLEADEDEADDEATDEADEAAA